MLCDTSAGDNTISTSLCVLAPTAVVRLKRNNRKLSATVLQLLWWSPPDVAPRDTTLRSRGHGPDKRGRPSAGLWILALIIYGSNTREAHGLLA